jgi:hypothetical protein
MGYAWRVTGLACQSIDFLLFELFFTQQAFKRTMVILEK